MEGLTKTYIMKNGIPIFAIAEKIGLPENTIYRRIQARGIQPIGYIGRLGFYAFSDFDKIAENISRAPKTRNGKPLKRRSPAPDDV